MNQPLVFSDYHHTSLYKSIELLFEKRLGGAVYRPIGLEWATEGFWHIFDADATRQQYLSMDQMYRPVDGTPPLNQFINNGITPNYFMCKDPEVPDGFTKAITLEEFKKLPIDIVIASIPQHIEPFKRLIAQYKPTAKLIVQVGNAWPTEVLTADNIMASAIINNLHGEKNYVLYHQEFDTTIFRPENWIVFTMNHPEIRTPEKNIFSFINILQQTSDYATFQELERRLPDWNFKSYGGQCRDGCITGSANLAHEIRRARFVYHLKPGGDGYGHILHNALACGRPVIYKNSDYAGKLGERVLIDGVSGINIEGLSLDGIIEKLTQYNGENQYRQLCQTTYQTFQKFVNFAEEEKDLRAFLDRLK